MSITKQVTELLHEYEEVNPDSVRVELLTKEQVRGLNQPECAFLALHQKHHYAEDEEGYVLLPIILAKSEDPEEDGMYYRWDLWELPLDPQFKQDVINEILNEYLYSQKTDYGYLSLDRVRDDVFFIKIPRKSPVECMDIDRLAETLGQQYNQGQIAMNLIASTAADCLKLSILPMHLKFRKPWGSKIEG